MNGRENKLIKWTLIIISILFLALMLGLPLIVVISESLSKGFDSYVAAIKDDYTLKAIKLTLIATVIATVLNTIFGISAAWAITKFKVTHKNLLNTLIDLPFAISPVISGLVFALSYGRGGYFSGVTESLGIKIIFAIPGIVLATIFVTFPLISRELIPLMDSQGKDEEEAAAMMGASGFTVFRKVTLPNIKWGLLYGIVLCIARAMGEFGAVSVVSGHIRGKTDTLPLHVEILYNEYQFSAAFAVASILVIMAIIILIFRNIIEWKSKGEV
ncbi:MULTISPECIES: sulfate ABC transporter permease subunit CysW [Clostridium]|uniref:Sulfate ABC transporter permease subunit CysW n=1 Tax=Clostridium cibarium TaxID=2762247 RepID=A0ABR8PT85_9CLOT|nr:sulfate ABC transporter permease subunit CysW [Clostridium sp. HBUAS56017]MBD7911319.1 sulfate ABC transporter permease subunit CysW [Clostridium cibarium]